MKIERKISTSATTRTVTTTASYSTSSTTTSKPPHRTIFQESEYSTYLKGLFEIFASNFSNNSTDTRLTNNKVLPFYLPTTFNERMQLYDLIRQFDELMKQHNIIYFMYGGTLLGSYRHHDMIPWDDDIDLFVPVGEKPNMQKYVRPVHATHILYEAGGHYKFYRHDGKQAGKYNWKWPYLDISFYDENDTHIWDHVETYGTNFTYPKNIVFPLHLRPLYNLELPAPRDTLAMLIWTYGFNSTCVMYGYSHMREGGGPSGKRKCGEMKNVFPFVEHVPIDGEEEVGVREIARVGDVVYRDLIVPEPKYAVGKMFQLTLQDGYTAPPGDLPSPNFTDHM